MQRALLLTLLLASVLVIPVPRLLAQTADRVIRGVVTDASGMPLPGASVSVKNTKIGATTDVNGRYTITVPQGAVSLTVSFIGMVAKQVPIGNSNTINVTLSEENTKLNEVVVVGYGVARRANLTTAQTSISSKELNRTVNTTLEQALQGRAAGVYITQNSGQPGGGISVAVRGISSINGTTEPLYVIDGVMIRGSQVSYGAQSSSNPLASINPADIEDMQILQGPSATAIYGSMATNGVVLITTKRGKAGDVKVNYGFQYNLQSIPQRLEVMNLREYAQMVKDFHSIAGGQTPQEFLDPSLLGEGTDWQQELFTNAPMQKHQLSLSGGTDKATYYVSGDYHDQDGVAQGSGFKRYSFRLNLDSKPKQWMTLNTNLSFSQTDETLNSTQEDLIMSAVRLTPQIPVKNMDGSWGGPTEVNGGTQYAPVNPIALASLNTNTATRRGFTGGTSLGINILPGLTFRAAATVNLGYSNSIYYRPKYKWGYSENPRSALTNGTSQSTYWSLNQQLQYTRQIKKHHLDIMMTHEAQKSTWRNLSGSRSNFLTDDILDLEAGDRTTATNSGGSGPWGMDSYLGRINYNFDDRYLLTATIRTDGSSNFGPDNRWGTFPSISAAWRISKEKFFNIPAISELKLRLETGITGNQGDGSYIYSPLTTGATPTGTGFLPSRYASPGLKWEETKTDNIGINIGILRNRFEIEADYYVKHTDNLLLINPLPGYMGSVGTGAVAAPMVNVGALTNKGWSFSVNSTNITTKNFKWTSNFNLSHFKTTIDRFYSPRASVTRTSWWLNNWVQRSVVGQSPWLFVGYIEDGLFQSLDEINNSAVPVDGSGQRLPTDQTKGVWVGDVKFRDISGPDGVPDGKITEDDQTFIGNPWPKLFGGFSNSLSYKGFELSMLVTGSSGNDIYNYVAWSNSDPYSIYRSQNLFRSATQFARPVTVDGVVKLENPGTKVARLSDGPNDNYAVFTNKWVENGSYLRLKNISITYNIPQSAFSRQKIVRGARLTVGVQNAWTITGYSGLDPEVGANVGRNVASDNQSIGLDAGRYPQTPIYTLSLGLDF